MTNTSLSTTTKSSNWTLSNGNLTATHSSTTTDGVAAIDSQHSGKFYFEAVWNTSTTGNNGIGVMTITADLGLINPGRFTFFTGTNGVIRDPSNATLASGSSNVSAGDVMCCAVDLDNHRIWFRKNNGYWNYSSTANPATNSGGFDISSIMGLGVWPFVTSAVNGAGCTFNFGDSAFAQSVPSGFTPGWPTNDDIQFDLNRRYNYGTGSTISPGAFSTDGGNVDVFVTILIATYDAVPGDVSSVSDTARLTWTQRQNTVVNNALGDVIFPENVRLSTYWAHSDAALSADTITVNFSSSVGFLVMVHAIRNASATAPFDTDESLPAHNSGSGSAMSVGGLSTVSPGKAFALVLGVLAQTSASETLTLPTQPILRQINSSTSWVALLGAQYFPNGLSSETLNAVRSGTGRWLMLGDVVVEAAIVPLELTAALAEDAGFDAAITIVLPPLELTAAFADEATLAAVIGLWPPLHLAAAFTEDAAFAAAITVLPAPLHLAFDLADGAVLAAYLTIGTAALRLAAGFADETLLTVHATLFTEVALAVAFTDDAELAAPVTIGLQPHAPPIQVVVVLSW